MPYPPAQMVLRCVFCNKSLQSSANRIIPRGLPQSARTPSKSAPKASACPHCNKPLPRCALCFQHLGCPDLVAEAHTRVWAKSARKDLSGGWDSSSSEFGHWFVWCQHCRHGGHAQHMREWFENHAECPVSGCHCRCMSLDRR